MPVALNTAMMAVSRRCAKVAAGAGLVQPGQLVAGEDRDQLLRDRRGLHSPSVGSGSSSSAASHLKNCCRARYWLLA